MSKDPDRIQTKQDLPSYGAITRAEKTGASESAIGSVRERKTPK